ncbi:MAG: glycosyltransferase family 4 protein [Thermoleophilales bacterium]|nr:glycosyltransferase family 4 protein [Thermoleophilales bacterium]
MKIQLWSCNYEPEPMGIAPLSAIWAKTMARRGHEVEVVAAHPHYPEPQWGARVLPYREVRDGIPVTRLPLIIGRKLKSQRLIQEVSFMTSQALASPFLGKPDVLISVTPSFPALLPGLIDVRMRKIPWMLWIQDILPDGAATTGYVDKSGPIYRLSRRLETASYNAASHIVVLSESFRENLMSKGVPREKVSLAYNPATMTDDPDATPRGEIPGPPRVICMGNIGKSQNLVEIVRAFEADPQLASKGAILTLAGAGVAEEEVRSAITTDRVLMPGVLGPEPLGEEIERTHLGAVTQAYSGGEFNVPSKLMNYLAVGLPVVASLRPGSEAGRIINESGAGWVSDSVDPSGFAASIVEAISDPEQLTARSRAGVSFARDNLTAEVLADRFEAALDDLA